MTPIVLQLQELASTSNSSVSELLRKARMVATKLKLDEFNGWLHHELHGYPQEVDVPEYRVLYGDLRAHNPMNGLLIPVRFGADVTDSLSKVKCRQSVGSLEELVSGNTDSLQVPLSSRELEFVHSIMDDFHRSWMLPFRRMSRTQVTAILDRVRSTILDWSLQLESEGIVGTGMTFSEEEKQRATTQAINIQNFQGILGNVAQSTVSQILRLQVVANDIASLRAFLGAVNLPAMEIASLEEAIESDGKPKVKGQLGPRVTAWLGNMVAKLGTGAYELTIGASAELLANAISTYYSL